LNKTRILSEGCATHLQQLRNIRILGYPSLPQIAWT
jgi:hypothetical protein